MSRASLPLLQLLLLLLILLPAPESVADCPDRPGRECPPEPDAEPTTHPPQLQTFVEARYPEDAAAARIEGTVQLELYVNAGGRVERVKVLRSVHAALDQAAVTAAEQFVFQPALVDGRPAPAVVRYNSSFALPPPPPPPQAPQEPGLAPAAEAAAGAPDSAPDGPETTPPEAPVEFSQVVRGRRPPRAASDWTLTLDATTVPAMASASELLARAPGLHIAQHAGEGKAHRIFLRGFDAVHGQDLEIVVGGIPINEVSNIHSHGYADLHFVIPEVVREMRVIEGAYDPRQGDFAVAGSIWLDLGLAERGLIVKGGGGSYGQARALVAWGPEGESERTFAAAEFARGDGFGPSRRWTRGAALGQYVVPLTPTLDLRLLGSTYAGRFDAAGVVRADDLDAGRMDLFDTYDPHQGGLSMRHQLLVGVEYAGERSTADLGVYLAFRELRLRQNFTGFIFEYRPVDTGGDRGEHLGDLLEQEHQALTIGGQGSYAREWAWGETRHGIEVGFRFRHDRGDQSQRRLRAVDQQPYWDELAAELTVTDVGLYLDLESRPLPWLHLRGGLRADVLAFLVYEPLEHYGQGSRRDSQGLHLGPKATVQLLPAEGLSLFASYGNGFRSPYAVSLGQGERTPFVTVHGTEAGARYRWDAILDATLAGFYAHVEEDLVFDHATGRNLFTGATRRFGGTLALRARPLDWLEATVNGSYTRAEYAASGDAVPYAVPLTLRAEVRGGPAAVARFWDRDLTIRGDLSATVVGPRPLPYSEETDSVFLLTLSAGVRLGEVELSVEVFNLLDTRWRDDEFAYVSNFESEDESPSLVPDRHVTAGRPLTAMGFLTVYLD